MRPRFECWPVRAQFQLTSVVRSCTVSARHAGEFAHHLADVARHVRVLASTNASWSYGSRTGSVCVDIM